MAQEFENVGLVCGDVVADLGGEGKGEDARDAGAEFEDGGSGCEEGMGGEEGGGGGEEGGEEGGYFPDDLGWIS